MNRRDETTTRVVITDLIDGRPPSIRTVKRVRRDDGREKVITQVLDVPDKNLWYKVLGAVAPGQEAEVTVVTEWNSSGYRTYLSALSTTVSSPTPVRAGSVG